MSCVHESWAGGEEGRNAAMAGEAGRSRGAAAAPGGSWGWGRAACTGNTACRAVRANFRGGIGRTPRGQALHTFAAAGSVVRWVGATQPVSCLPRPARREARGEGKNSTAVLPGALAPWARDFLSRAVPPRPTVAAAPRLCLPMHRPAPSVRAIPCGAVPGNSSPSVPSKSKSGW